RIWPRDVENAVDRIEDREPEANQIHGPCLVVGQLGVHAVATIEVDCEAAGRLLIVCRLSDHLRALLLDHSEPLSSQLGLGRAHSKDRRTLRRATRIRLWCRLVPVDFHPVSPALRASRFGLYPVEPILSPQCRDQRLDVQRGWRALMDALERIIAPLAI